MLNIKNELSGKNLTVELEGRLDTMTAPELEEFLNGHLDGIENLVFKLDSLEYISSAGLRVLLSAQKTMNKQSSMVVRGAVEEVKEIFEVTGFSDILTIE